MQEGDLLAVLDAGAYGMSLASNYNTRPASGRSIGRGKKDHTGETEGVDC